MNLNKDYKIMACLIPIILILSVVMYIFPDVTGINTDLAAPLLLNQTNNTTYDINTNNSTILKDQSQSTNIQGSQYSSTDYSNNNNYQPNDSSDTSDTGSNTDNSTSTDANTPTDNPTDTNTTG